MQQQQLILDGRYELRHQIGEGGFSRAYLAHDHRLGRDVVAKILRVELSTDAATLQRFEREARIAASVSGPNIVDVYDYGMTNGQPVIISQLISGVDLSRVIRPESGLRYEDAIDIMLDVLGGLETLHRAGIQHRDIKPQNILIPKWDAPAKLTDFGISRSSNDPRLTDPGTVLGSPIYMSPEQIDGRPVTIATDIYSASVVMFELLTGRPPFRGESGSQVMIQHLQKSPPAPRSLKPEIPLQLERIVLKGLEKDPTDRFRSAREMAEALVAVRNTPSPGAGPTYEPDRTRYMPADDQVTVISKMPERREAPVQKRDQAPAPRPQVGRKRGFQRERKQVPLRNPAAGRSTPKPTPKRSWLNIRMRTIPRYPVIIMLVLLIAVLLLAAIQGT
ncbi:MAG: serine/threonine protein kinase [Sphaerobacteraceae bacterium]|nr:MAG: serine/threonine protein kinase [Sphaerobacteraceae bacterium]